MKTKFFFLSTVISSCILTVACNQSTADELNRKVACGGQQSPAQQPSIPQYQPEMGGAVTNPNMPTGQAHPGQAQPGQAQQGQSATSNQGGKRPCYPASKCTGDPNLIGGPNQYNNQYDSTTSSFSPSNTTSKKMLQIESTEKFVGTVESINRVTLPNQTQIQMVLKTDQGEKLIILGPASYIDQQKIKFVAGDKVTVTGYRITANGSEVIMAAQVQKNGNTLQLLNETRQPAWGGYSSY
jgi:hypothetical protein